MNEKCDIYSYFWDNNQEKPNWGNIRRINTKLTFRQKICSLYLLKDKQEGRNKLKNIISNKEYVKENGRLLYLNFTDKKSECELSYLKNSVENISFPFDQANIPKHAYLIEISFKLKKPYISRDDEDFYIIDNPIIKDKVFKVPMVRASTWKGALRFAAEKVDKNKGEIIKRLFGNDKRENENQKRGRLTFYPTFFDSISLDVITPLDRETKTPSLGPIYFETVPKNTNGKLRILYYPYDLIAVGEVDRIEEEAKEDFEFLGEALRKMFYEIGFSAKKTSGFGVVEINEIKIIPNNELSEKLKKFLWENL